MLKRKKKSKEEIEKNKAEIEKQNSFFLEIWKRKSHNSEIDGTYLGKEPLTIFFHHVLSKKKYPEFKYYKKNIILLTGDQHSTVEGDMYKYEKINKLREKLLIEYYYLCNPDKIQIGLQEGIIKPSQVVEILSLNQ